jgi:hypothetical protein
MSLKEGTVWKALGITAVCRKKPSGMVAVMVASCLELAASLRIQKMMTAIGKVAPFRKF